MKQLSTARNSTAPGAIVAALAYWLLASTAPACAADVSYERLLNPEPQNWLMHHRDFNAQRYSPLQVINKSNAKNLKLQFAVALGGKSAADSLEATPLVEDGFMYIVDSWGVVYKIDVRSGTVGTIIWKMDPGLTNQDRNRGAALWGKLLILVSIGTCGVTRQVKYSREDKLLKRLERYFEDQQADLESRRGFGEIFDLRSPH
jgi:hypothetical protein